MRGQMKILPESMPKAEFGRLFEQALRPWSDKLKADPKMVVDYYQALNDIAPRWLRVAFSDIQRVWMRENGLPTPADIRKFADSAREKVVKEQSYGFKQPEATKAESREILARIQPELKVALSVKRWRPKTDLEREGAALFADIVHGQHGVAAFPALNQRGARALSNFGGMESIKVVDAESVALARQVYTQFYVVQETEEGAVA